MIILKDYPYYALATPDDVRKQVEEITHTRKDDITQIQNINNSFWQGRSVGRIPSGSADVITGDKSGDLSYDANYIYILVGAVWRRASLGSW